MGQIYSTGIRLISLLFLVGCAGLPPFPAKSVFETDLVNGVCAEYEIIEPRTLKFRKLKNWPLSKCDGVFGFQPEETGKVFTWVRNAVKQCEQCSKVSTQNQIQTLGLSDGDTTVKSCEN